MHAGQSWRVHSICWLQKSFGKPGMESDWLHLSLRRVALVWRKYKIIMLAISQARITQIPPGLSVYAIMNHNPEDQNSVIVNYYQHGASDCEERNDLIIALRQYLCNQILLVSIYYLCSVLPSGELRACTTDDLSVSAVHFYCSALAWCTNYKNCSI